MPKLRDSNFELLRVIAIILVLLLHADFFALDGPGKNAIISCPVDSTLRIIVQSISIIAVDVFVMISGWFSIKQSKRSILNLIFQTLFYLILIYAVAISLGYTQISSNGLEELILATSSNWFIKAYLLLYILAPVLNRFSDTTNRSEFKHILISFFAFQTIYGLIFYKSTDYFQGGYSPLSFIGLYLLARYVKIYQPNWVKHSLRSDLTAIFSIVIAETAVCVIPALLGLGNDIVYGYILLTYICPTTILVALLSISAVSKIKITSSVINRLGLSSFAVYLVFVNPNILSLYKSFFKDLYSQIQGIDYWLIVIAIVITLYLIVACFDSIRIYLWHRLQSKTCK